MSSVISSAWSLVILILTLAMTQGQQPADVVQTTLGPVQGLRKNVLNLGDVDVYYGIPYAAPPVGDLRFLPPQPAQPWTEVLTVTNPPNSCVQSIDTAFGQFPGVDMWNPNTPVSEDCLYINVWVPRGFPASQAPRATMVWIYGGGFSSGSSTLDVYDAYKLAAVENVIVFSLNYRLGVLGFLYTGTDDAPGNQGLLDQAEALKFIHANVARFGGRRATITLFGESAGAGIVGLNLLSPLSKPYFARAIMQSGSPNADWATMPGSLATTRAQRLAEALGCPVGSMAAMVDCLRTVNAQNLTDSMFTMSSCLYRIPFAPVVDGHFLLDHPSDLMARGEVKDTELIIGVNKDEGMYFLLYRFPDDFPLDNTGTVTPQSFSSIVHRMNCRQGRARDDATLFEYVDSTLPSQRHSFRDIADDVYGDLRFKCPAIAFANAYASLRDSHRVYLYSFDHRLTNNPWPAWTGVLHGYEIEAVFLLPQSFNYTKQEKALARRMAGYWTRFAQFGDPTGNSSAWPRLTSQQAAYLHLTDQGDSVHQGLRHRPCAFRDRILPLLQQDADRACQTDDQTSNAAPPGYRLLLSLALVVLPSLGLL